MAPWDSAFLFKMEIISPISNSESTIFLMDTCYVFFFNCSNWENFAENFCENIWWIRYLAGGFLVAVKFLKKKLQWWFF